MMIQCMDVPSVSIQRGTRYWAERLTDMLALACPCIGLTCCSGTRGDDLAGSQALSYFVLQTE